MQKSCEYGHARIHECIKMNISVEIDLVATPIHNGFTDSILFVICMLRGNANRDEGDQRQEEDRRR